MVDGWIGGRTDRILACMQGSMQQDSQVIQLHRLPDHVNVDYWNSVISKISRQEQIQQLMSTTPSSSLESTCSLHQTTPNDCRHGLRFSYSTFRWGRSRRTWIGTAVRLFRCKYLQNANNSQAGNADPPPKPTRLNQNTCYWNSKHAQEYPLVCFLTALLYELVESLGNWLVLHSSNRPEFHYNGIALGIAVRLRSLGCWETGGHRRAWLQAEQEMGAGARYET